MGIEEKNTYLNGYKKFSAYSSLIAIAVCLAILAGWATGSEMLTRISPIMVAMNPITAISLIFTAIAVRLFPVQSPQANTVYKILAVLIFLIGFIRLADYTFELNLHFDHILFREHLFDPLTGKLNGMSLLSALNFILLGAGLFLIKSPGINRLKLSQYFCITAGFVSLLSILGYIYGVPMFYEFFHLLPMGLHTSLLFIALTVSVIFLRPAEGVMELISSRSISGSTIRRLIPALIIIPVVLGILRLYSEVNGIISREAGVSFFVFLIIIIPLLISWKNLSLLYNTDKNLRETERKVIDNEVKLRTIIENSNDSIYIKNLEGKYIMINPAGAATMNKTPEDVIGKTDIELVGERQGTAIGEKDREVLQENKVLTYEVLRNMGSVPAYFNTTKFPYTDEKGDALGIIGISRNITAKKEVENELKKLSIVAQFSPNGIIITDKKGRIEWVNEGMIQKSGYSREELLGSYPEIFFRGPMPEEDYLKKIWEQMEKKKPFEIEALNYKKGGIPYWIMLSISPIFNEHGEIEKYVSIQTDISEKKEMINKLQESHKFLNEILNKLGDPIIVKDREHRFVVVNDAFCEFINCSKESFIGRTDYDFFPAEQADVFREKDEEVFTTGKDNINEEHITGIDGKNHIILTKKALLTINEVQYIVAIISDITSLREKEEKIKQYNLNLTKINKELDQFAYVVSHDLKAPLRAIANLSEWIKEDMGTNLPDDVGEKLGLMQGRVHRMEALINGILEYSRIGREKREIEKVDLNTLLPDIIDSISPPGHIRINIIGKMPVIQGKRVRIQQIFSNLISNAVKYNDKPEGIINISSKISDGMYEFCIEDNGPGIEQEYHEKVFVIFQRLEARDKVEGTGIGLSLVKKIIEEKGGHIRIESQPGKGAKFIFSIPIILKQ